MGKEYVGTARVDGIAKPAKVHLDSAALRLSGAHRFVLPLADVRTTAVRDEVLVIESGLGRVELELGARRARAWQTAIVAPKTLLEKLGLRARDRICVRNLADAGFLRDVTALLGRPPATALRGTFDTIVLGVRSLSELCAIGKAAGHLDPRGGMWVVYPKGKNSPVPEAAVRAEFTAHRLYDAKVAAFSTELTAVKAMVRIVDRPPPSTTPRRGVTTVTAPVSRRE